jgi:phenylpropionate dioxygenase-like ring-hydroxylating dioxygenase large terminal subunit
MTSALNYHDLVKEDRVHSLLYKDQTVFDEEMERIFSRSWIFVGHEGEIPNAGDYRLRKMGRQPVILVRDDNGAVQLMFNRCTHRGNALCNLEEGTTRAFTCSYHGWRFRLNGKLAAVPYSDRYDSNFRNEDNGLVHVARVESRRGFIFATLNEADVPLDTYLGAPTLAELDDIADLSPEGELEVTAGVHKTRFAANWKFQNENAIDGYHPNFAHRSFFDVVQQRTGFDPKVLATSAAPARVRHLGNGHCTWDSRAFNKIQNRAEGTYRDLLVQRLGERRADEVLAKIGSHLYIFPNFIYVGAHFRIVQPIRPDETEVQLFPIFLKGAPDAVNTARLRQHERSYGPSGGVNSDDLDIFTRNQFGVAAEANPWVLMSRGSHLEERLNDGTVSGQITDELTNRAIWHRWKELMTRCDQTAEKVHA